MKAQQITTRRHLMRTKGADTTARALKARGTMNRESATVPLHCSHGHDTRRVAIIAVADRDRRLAQAQPAHGRDRKESFTTRSDYDAPVAGEETRPTRDESLWSISWWCLLILPQHLPVPCLLHVINLETVKHWFQLTVEVAAGSSRRNRQAHDFVRKNKCTRSY